MSFWEKASALGQSAYEKMEKFNADVEHWMYVYRNYDNESLDRLARGGPTNAKACAARRLLKERGYDF